MTRKRWEATQHATGPQTQGKAMAGGSMAILASVALELYALYMSDRLTLEYLAWYLREHGDVIAGELLIVFGAVYNAIYWTTNRIKRAVKDSP